MRERLPVFLGIFAVMALSNAIVPVLPRFAEGAAAQGILYSSYFLGAFLLTLPAGILADRWGPVPVIRAGLLVTLISGILMLFPSWSPAIIAGRLLEGFGAGLFVASALAWVNARPDHARESGIFLALMNIGLVGGLVISGLVIEFSALPVAGIMLFTVLSLVPLAASLFMRNDRAAETRHPAIASGGFARNLVRIIRDDFWLWISSVILVGITGVVASLYPGFTGETAANLGLEIAAMNIATVIAVLLISRLRFPPVTTLRIAALLMAVAVFATFLSPYGFILVGAIAGVVMVAQLAFLAQAETQQGIAMGLWSTTGYLGMTLLPFIAGVVAEQTTFFFAFAFSAVLAVLVALTIGRCSCRLRREAPGSVADTADTGGS
ncbi:MAG: MFS transporter [Methanoregulaceae archaeon]|nr:MFS transporter [Methanoregulaceae archaeon]